MGYEIDFHKIKDPEHRHHAALHEVRMFLTKQQHDSLWTIAMWAVNYRQFSFYIHFAGITGYPCVAFWNEVRRVCREMQE